MEQIGRTMKMALGSTKTSELPYKTCPKCGEKKEMEVNILGINKRVPVMCKCESAERNKKKEIEANKDRMRKLDRLQKYSLMDSKFKECTFEKFIVDESNRAMYKLAKRYCKNWPEMKKRNIGFMFWGPPGIGKSYLTYCIANELLKKMVPVMAITPIALINRIYDNYNKFGAEGEVAIINSLNNASLLIIDDLGAEHEHEKGKQIIYSIIDSRDRSELPTIVTTNLTPNQLKEKMAQKDGVYRTYDRLIEMCPPIEIRGQSKRIKTARRKQEVIKELLK